MKSKIAHYIKEIALFLIFMTLLMNALSLYKSQDLNKEAFALKDIILVDNQKYIIPHAKPILIHFWATWCPTCKFEASNIQKVSEHYEVLSIAVKSGSDDDIKHFLQSHELNYKVVNDKNGFLANKFNIAAYPSTFIYDKDKNLVLSEVGYTSTWGLLLRMWWAGI
jgi:thiol-disulfide isomerase/thioredoxin